MFNYTDKTALLYVITRIKALLEGYVIKEDGKSLTSNDFSNELKTKLDNIAEGATKTIIDATVTSDGVNPVSGAAIYAELVKKASLANPEFIGVPKAPTASDGTNTNQIATTAFVMTAIAGALGEISGLSFVKVDRLPETGSAGVIYLVPKAGAASDVYDEYFWYEGSFEYMGTTAVDLTGYVKESDMVPITSQEIDAMFA